MDSFVEWKRVDAKTKLPWIFAMKYEEPFALAGLYRRRQMSTEERLVADYAGTGLTIGKHPMHYRRT